MLLLVELSVEQKKGKLAKDALYQYKNIAQNTNVGTIEVRCHRDVIREAGRWLTKDPACSQEVHRVGSGQGYRCPGQGRRGSVDARGFSQR